MKIVELLKEQHGNKTLLAEKLGISYNGLNKNLKGKITPLTQERITKAYNDCFNTSYTRQELF